MASDVVATEQRISTAEYFEDWLAHMAGRVRPKTLEGYQGLIRHNAIPSLGAILLRELHALHLQRLYADLLREGSPGGPR